MVFSVAGVVTAIVFPREASAPHAVGTKAILFSEHCSCFQNARSCAEWLAKARDWTSSTATSRPSTARYRGLRGAAIHKTPRRWVSNEPHWQNIDAVLPRAR